MCIIVDSNTLAAVLNPTDSEHRQFKPVLDHINSGKSKMIFGGSRFEGEVRKLPKYIKILAEMRKANKIAFASGYFFAVSIKRKIGCLFLLNIVTSPA